MEVRHKYEGERRAKKKMRDPAKAHPDVGGTSLDAAAPWFAIVQDPAHLCLVWYK